MYYLIYSSFCREDNKYTQSILLSGTKENCLNALHEYTDLCEDSAVFFVNEELIGDILIREFATIELGYNHSFIVVNESSIIKSVKIVKTKTTQNTKKENNE